MSGVKLTEMEAAVQASIGSVCALAFRAGIEFQKRRQ